MQLSPLFERFVEKATNLRRDKNRKKIPERRILFSSEYRELKDNFTPCFFSFSPPDLISNPTNFL